MQLHNYIFYDPYATYMFLMTLTHSEWVIAALLTERENSLYYIKKCN